MEPLRKPFFVGAVVLIALAVLLEAGGGMALQWRKVDPTEATNIFGPEMTECRNMLTAEPHRPPGMGIPRMALLDGLILFTVGLMGAQFWIGERLQGRFQGIASLWVSLLVLVSAITSIFSAVAKVLLMVGLLVAVPFGTVLYLVTWGLFDTGGAKAVLGLLLMLKLGFGTCLVLAHQRFLQNKGLVLIIVTSLLANLVVSFFHALVPSFLVSITDGIAAIVVLVLAAIWAVLFLIGSVTSVRRAIA